MPLTNIDEIKGIYENAELLIKENKWKQIENYLILIKDI